MKRLKRLSRKYVFRLPSRTQHGRRIERLKNHPFIVPVSTFLVLFVLSAVAFIALGGQTVGPTDAHIVQLSVDGVSRTVPTRAGTVKDLLERQNVTLQKEDIVEPNLDSRILESNVKVTVSRARPVTIVDQGRKTTVLSAHRQPRVAVQEAGIKLSTEDAVTLSQSTNFVQEMDLGQQIVIDRAIAVKLSLYGKIVDVNTRAKTVKQLLDEKNIAIKDDAQVFPSPSTRLASAQTVVVANEGQKVEVVEEAIEAATETVDDPSIPVGESRVVQQGTPGRRVVAYQVNAAGRQLLYEFEAVRAVKTVVHKGSKVIVLGTRAEWLAAAGISPAEYAAADYIIGAESGWCPTKWQGEYGGCPAYHGTPSSAGVGYGLCQATPGYKMASAGADWGFNAVTQLKWCTNYAKRYGGWQGAAAFWRLNHWW